MVSKKDLVAAVKKAYEDWSLEVLSLLSPSSELIVCVEQDVAKLHEFMTTPSAGGITLSSPERTLSFCKISSLSCLFLFLFVRGSEFVCTR